jgi:hypothetical protein
MFQVKSFLSIVASMLNRMRATTTLITDYNVGAVGRTLLEAPAQEIDQLYQEMLHGLVEAIPVSTFNTFSFPALPALPATNLIRVSVASSVAAVLIAAGTVFTRPGGVVTYTSTSDETIAVGDTFVDVPVAATSAGTIGNLAADAVFSVSPAPAGFVSATNLSAFLNGVDAETQLQRLARFQQFIQTLSRATVPSLSYALLQLTFLTDGSGNITERVISQNVIEPYKQDPTQPVGLVWCYIHNGEGGTSLDLVQQGQLIIDGYYNAAGVGVPGYKAAGVHVIVFAAPEEAVNVSAVITVAAGVDIGDTELAVQSAIFSYIQGIPVGFPFVAAKAYAIAMGIAGVTDYVPTSSADVPMVNTTKAMPGTISIVGGFVAAGVTTSTGTATLT